MIRFDQQSSSSTQPIGFGWIVFSVALGSLILGIFLPLFLIVCGFSLLGIPVLIRLNTRQLEQVSRDIHAIETDRNEALHIASLLRSVIDAADIPILATDEDGRVAHTNRKAQDVLGVTHLAEGRRFDEMMTQRALHDLEMLARQGEPGHARLVLPVDGELRHFDVSADPVRVSNGAVLTFRDITELSRAVTLKADFAANASHELRTPIASIKAATETLAGAAKTDERMSNRLIEMITSNANRLEMLASDLLDLSKLEADDQPAMVVPVHLGKLIEKIAHEHASALERRNLELAIELDDDTSAENGEGALQSPEPIDLIQTDPALLDLILRNLIQNAAKFAHEGTTIRVRAHRAKVVGDRTIPIPSSLDSPMGLVISVIDKGIGIPLSHQQRIFERFYQVDDARTGSGAKRGTGLGLAIVKHAARRLGGSIHLESVYQVGTTMFVELPRCVEPGRRENHPIANDSE